MYEEMNQQTLAAIWKSVLEQVQDAVSEPVYRTWFCQLELIAYVNGQAFLKARGEIEKK